MLLQSIDAMVTRTICPTQLDSIYLYKYDCCLHYVSNGHLISIMMKCVHYFMKYSGELALENLHHAHSVIVDNTHTFHRKMEYTHRR